MKSGTFEVDISQSLNYSFDTGLGNAVKRVVIMAENPNASTGPFSMIGWNLVYPDYYKYATIGAATTGGTGTIQATASQNVVLGLTKRPDQNNGIVELNGSTLNANNKKGTYHWYAE